MKSKILTLLAAGLLAGSLTVHAGVILQDQHDAAIQIFLFEPIGQSFTAEDSKIDFAFFYDQFNADAPHDPFQLQLRDGDGLGGTVLGSTVFALPTGFTGFLDVDFSSIVLTVGQKYTAVLNVVGTSPYGGVEFQQATNPYAGGRAYFTSGFGIDNVPGDDMRFRVTPTSGRVPEPATLALLGLGFAGLGFSRRKQ